VPAGQEDGGGNLEGLPVLVNVDNHLWQRPFEGLLTRPEKIFAQERAVVVGGRRDLPRSVQARRTWTWTRSYAGCSSSAASVEAAVAMEAAAAALSWSSSREIRADVRGGGGGGEDGVAGSRVQRLGRWAGDGAAVLASHEDSTKSEPENYGVDPFFPHGFGCLGSFRLL
jgi:hypothetical protein